MKKKRIFILSICSAVLVVGIMIGTLRQKRQVLYRVTYLPSLGGEFTSPRSINDRGQIAGISQVKDGNDHLFLWDREKGIQDLGLVSGNTSRINNSGQIAANMEDSNGNNRAFIWDPNHDRHVLPTLGGNTATAREINNHGQVVGWAETASGVTHAFVWDAVNGIRDLTPYSTSASASSINDAGQVVVSVDVDPRLVDVNEGVTAESPLIPVYGPNKLNNKGFTAGSLMIGPGKHDIGLWHPDSGKIRLLHLNMDSPRINLINDVNQVVFWERQQSELILFGRLSFKSGDEKNYLHDPSLGVICLDDYVAIGSKENFTILDINNKGCITGVVQSSKDSSKRGVLLEPIPEKWNKYSK